MSGTKYKGSALYMDWLPSAGGTVVLWAERRSFSVDETANQIDVTTASDTAKSFLTDFPAIKCTAGGLDTTGTVTGGTPAQFWDRLNIGDTGTVRWGPEGTVTGYRKRSMPGILSSKKFDSPYDNAATWELSFDSNGGTIAGTVW